ncbi:DNA-binding MarR family transcriptional regulator [Desulfohalotomaculum tongense]|uniref:MarR family winged helix-turn-helix transcriptional regulator n=1 Tax=Desulforadius tongensis TaxID=1216062 RepID=UPI001957F803|nr:MarR family winged helix-turn-helix transcriptional regulator [Desulforadius tongensis]MBM7854630.1 DNA-binding MarR family transcriptional regulator [Desulforadius tongensis]
MKQKKHFRQKRKQSKLKKRQKFLQGDLNKTIASLLKDHPCKNDPLLAERWRLWMYLRRLYHSLDVAFERELKSFVLTPAQFTALLTIITIKKLSMSDLAELCLWNRSTASRITHSLQKKKLITISPVDGKTSALKATAKGQKLAALYMAKEAELFKHSLMIITGEALENNDVYEWLKNSVIHLIGKEVIEYVETIYRHIKSASSPGQPLQAPVCCPDPSDS